MQAVNHHITTSESNTALLPELHNTRYAELLKARNLTFREDNFFLYIGPQTSEGWILDISVIISEMEVLLPKLIDILSKERVGFCMPATAQVAVTLLTTDLGYDRFGKVIMVFPHSTQVVSLAEKLVRLTNGLKGPAIPSAAFLGGTVYAHHSAVTAIPFTLPRGVNWPFKSLIAKPRISKRSEVLNGKYVPFATIKNDIKGRVQKGINIAGWMRLHFDKCLIKEGKRDMSYDQQGRSIIDRLMMQRDVYNQLKDIIPMPRVLDYFERKGDAFLVTEFIEGVSLLEAQSRIMEQTYWPALKTSRRRTIAEYFIVILAAIEAMHNKGYFHRDITPPNFMIDKTGKLFFIDLELAYNVDLFKARPPFTYGTPDFMSPAQEKGEAPAAEDDIYALGGLGISMITGLPPSRFRVSDPITLAAHLDFFVEDAGFVDCLVRARHQDPSMRPPIAEMRLAAVKIMERDWRSAPEAASQESPQKAQIDELLKKHLVAYGAGRMGFPDGKWFSYPPKSPTDVANPSYQRTVSYGLYSGIAGTLYALSMFKTAGFDLSPIEKEIITNCGQLQTFYLDNPAAYAEGGLYTGSFGVAAGLSAGMEAGMIIDNDVTRSYLVNLLSRPCQDLSVGTGIAGLALAAIACARCLPEQFVQEVLTNCTAILLKEQQKNGYWLLPDGNKRSFFTGYSNGVAGICRALLEIGNCTGNMPAMQAAKRGLNWLCSQATMTDQKVSWPVTPGKPLIDQWFDIGVTGIVYTLCRAFELDDNPKYRELALAGLNGYPEYILHPNSGLHTGITGLALTYDYASRVFGHPELRKRGDHITRTLFNTTIDAPDDGAASWLTIHSDYPTADFMNGSAGIAYYLLQLHNESLQQKIII